MNNLNSIIKLAVIAGVSVAIVFAAFQLYMTIAHKEVSLNVSKQIITNETHSNIDQKSQIKVGVLHSLTGTMAISEKPVVDATLLAIDEINNEGGILGREIRPIVLDGKSDWPTFAKQADYLITKEHVSAVFGGWTSASRKTMKPVFEEHNNLLFYPVQYEGLEKSPNIVYTGAAPNQQVVPAVDWALKNLGDTFFLVGSDYVFPRSANEIIKSRIHELGGKVVGEEYKLLGDTNFNDIIDKILETKPKVILNTINGDSNVWFFKELRERGITSEQIPTISFSIAESEIQQIGTGLVKGDYAVWNYFQTVDTPENRHFVKAFKEKYGQDRVVSDPMEAAYIAVYLFAIATNTAGSDDVNKIREAVPGITFAAPEGIVGVDPENHHIYKTVRMGKILSDGQFQIVESTESSIKPIPYPNYKSVNEWDEFLKGLYEGWGKKWANS